MGFKKVLFYVFAFFASFLFFVYISFPYTVLKEAAVNKIASTTGLQLGIAKLSPVLPLGFDFKDVQVKLPSGDAGIELKEVDVRIKVLSLLMGDLAIGAQLLSSGGGSLEIDLAFGIFDLLSGEALPSHIELDAQKFKLGHITKFGLAKAQEALKRDAIISDLLSKFSITGDLSGMFSIALNKNDIKSSRGKIDLKITSGKLAIDPSMNVSDQNFIKALIRASLSGGALKIDPDSGFHTNGLRLDFKGQIGLKKELENSVMDLSLSVKLLEELKGQFGYFIDNGLGGTGGAFDAQIRGTVGHPNFVTL